MPAIRRRPFPLAVGVSLALAASACGASTDHRAQGSSSSSSSGGRSSSGGSSGGSSGASSSGASSSGSGSSGAASSSSGGNQCAGSSTRAQRQALDIYVMLDRSGSMNDPTGSGASKWEAVTAALSSFVGQPLDDTSVGLQYFGLGAAACSDTTSCSTDADCGYCGGTCVPLLQRCVGDRRASSCSAADYAKPEVEIGPIAQTGPLIRTSMAAQTPSTDTPTSAALQGAIDHARTWASDAAHAGHAVLVVFATDGEPTVCDQNLDHIDAIAAAGLSASPSIRTFVIGVGDLQDNLDGIAKAGGTSAAYIVDTGADVTDQFLKALNDIRGKTVGCSYAIPAPPAGQKLDYGLVNVTYTPGSGGAPITLGKVANATACGTSAHAWHYDDEATHGSIVLCPSTCAVVQADAAARVDIVLGCQTTGEF